MIEIATPLWKTLFGTVPKPRVWNSNQKHRVTLAGTNRKNSAIFVPSENIFPKMADVFRLGLERGRRSPLRWSLVVSIRGSLDLDYPLIDHLSSDLTWSALRNRAVMWRAFWREICENTLWHMNRGGNFTLIHHSLVGIGLLLVPDYLWRYPFRLNDLAAGECVYWTWWLAWESEPRKWKKNAIKKHIQKITQENTNNAKI